MHIHLGIIDADPVRLITSVLDPSITVDKMIFIGTDCQQEQYARLSSILTAHGIHSDFYAIPDTIEMSVLRHTFHHFANALSDEPHTSISFNASCGLRHRLLSAYEVFRSYQWPIYVIEPYSDERCWLNLVEAQQTPVAHRISIAEYLTIFNARSEFPEHTLSDTLHDELWHLGQRWADHAIELGPGLATLNYLATTCRKEQCLDVELSEKQQGYKELGDLIADLESMGLATYHNGVLTFAHEEARRFANGEWLESLVHCTVEAIREEMTSIQDLSLGVQVYRKIGDREVRNELDVAVVKNNKLHIIECKTKGMRDDGDDTLYKLESLRDLLGGLQSRAMLVSFRPLRHHDIVRAQDLGLALIGPEQLCDLRQHLTEWLSKATMQEQTHAACGL